MPEQDTEEDQEMSEVERIQADAEAALTEVNSSKEEVAGLVEEIRQQRQAAQTAADFVATKKTEITTTATQISSLVADAKLDRETTEDLAEKSTSLGQTIEQQSNKLKQLTNEASELSGQIEQLLPGATSTGLAKSFMDRRASFIWPKRGWAILTLVSIFSLVLIGVTGNQNFVQLARQPGTGWTDLFRAVMWRIPIALPMIWLAIHAGRHHFLAARLEEDYGYKEVLSRSFEGYKRELENVTVQNQEVNPLSRLCANVLSALATPPGRLFDKKHVDFTPVNALVDSVDPKLLAELAKRYDLTQDQLQELIKMLAAGIGKR